MKPLVKKHRKFSARLRPGGVLLIRPPVLRHLGWSIRRDVILCEWKADRVILNKKPSEKAWRIERLLIRIDTQRGVPTTGDIPRTLAEFRAVRPGSGRRYWLTERQVVFEALGTRHESREGDQP